MTTDNLPPDQPRPQPDGPQTVESTPAPVRGERPRTLWRKLRRISPRAEIALRAGWLALARKWPAVWRRLRWLLLRATALAGTFLLVLLALTASAAWYTSRSEFCNSCHIMEPYYKSWQESSHSHVPCIDCHFAPGFGGKLRGKLLGLVQLAKYLTKSEGPRPAAEIPDSSCLRSGCHESRLLSGRVEYRGINFDHTPHLPPPEPVGPSHLRGPSDDALTSESDAGREDRDRPREWLRRQLRCTSCHGQIVQGTHMAVTLSTCFLCHFKDEPFNEGLGACTHCHQIPDKEYDLGGGVKFSHELAFKRGVDCANCHGDVIRGKGEVPRERCQVCHNREDALARVGDAKFMHTNHVADHKIDCLDCHLQIEHSLDPQRLEHAVRECSACHPNHHHEQIQMFLGTGAKTIPVQPGTMLNTRVGCRTCHRLMNVSATGSVLWKSSDDVCAACHERSEVEKLRLVHEQMRASLPVIQAALERLREALGKAKLDEKQAAALKARLEDLQHDLNFLRVGNDIHNTHYAATLNRTLVDQVSELARKLGVPPPSVTLPPPRPGK